MRDRETFYKRTKRAFKKGRYLIRFHVRLRMRERGISEDEVWEVIYGGEVIEYYPEDKPYPSCLLFKEVRGKPLHVVCALSPEGTAFLVTVYIPSLERWKANFRRRKHEMRGLPRVSEGEERQSTL